MSNTIICKKCMKNQLQSSINFYKDEIDTISSILSNQNIYINSITCKISGYCYNITGHYIDYSRKYRNIITYYRTHICTKCFQLGIYLSLKKQKRLPFLRIDINYFINKDNVITEEIINNIKNEFTKYIFPSLYSCVYYRQSNPTICNKLFVIKTFN